MATKTVPFTFGAVTVQTRSVKRTYEIEWTTHTTKRDDKGNASVTHRMTMDKPINRVRQYIMNDSTFRNVTGAITVRLVKVGSRKTVGDMMRWKGVWEWTAFPSHANCKVRKDGSLGPVQNKSFVNKGGTLRRM